MSAIATSDNVRPRRSFRFAGALLATILGIAGAQAASPATHLNPQVIVTHHHWYQLGIASWYGKFFQGRTTASGEPFDENQLTCAHRTLPLGSVLRVTNLRNHKSVVVTVNDRGPVPESRVIDLSRAAASVLGFSDQGLAPVKVELIGPQQEVAQLLMPAGLESPRN
ncbi:MAG TPA: septal ring lytic transglycosylase RlpA family protein [Acidobacteriaceae bacterium]|jgi:rare lipoprotein A|nr:septal ring lytic transglycosylase RlpA family protein [Acidobacteriaceae bacterium]